MAEQSQCSVGNDEEDDTKKRKRSRDDDNKEKGLINDEHPPNSLMACLKHLYPGDFILLFNFLSSHPETRFREDALSSVAKAIVAYTRLADLLRLLLLHRNTLGPLRDLTLESLRDLRTLSFAGPWFDSFEHYFARNPHPDLQQLDRFVQSWTGFSERQGSSIVDIYNRHHGDDHLSEQSLRELSEALGGIVDKYKRQHEDIEAQLVHIRNQKNAILDARAALAELELDLSSPTLFRNIKK